MVHDSLLRTLWLLRLAHGMQAILATQKGTALEKVADAIVESSNSRSTIPEASKPSPDGQFAMQEEHRKRLMKNEGNILEKVLHFNLEKCRKIDNNIRAAELEDKVTSFGTPEGRQPLRYRSVGLVDDSSKSKLPGNMNREI
ncbi:hypothetical protein CBL_04851 [Carabus blaptoides fortunei]